jgi:uncharacterized membrane protein
MGVVSTAPTVLAAFAASLVEFIEALTVVLAVGAVRGWQWALVGSAAGLVLLAALVAVLGPSMAHIPIGIARLVVGMLLLMFGLRWLRKAILRYAGAIALHDERAAYARQTAALRAVGAPAPSRWDRTAFATSCNIVLLEGVEVAFIVIAIGADGRSMGPAALGAVAALLAVVCLGFALHRPLANIPENLLKFGVGILLCAFGTYWFGEGIDLEWPLADGWLLILIGLYLVLAQGLVLICRARLRPPQRTRPPAARAPKGVLAALLHEVVSLFVDDVALAGGVLLWAAAAGWSAGHVAAAMPVKCGVLVVGFFALLSWSALRAVRR